METQYGGPWKSGIDIVRSKWFSNEKNNNKRDNMEIFIWICIWGELELEKLETEGTSQILSK